MKERDFISRTKMKTFNDYLEEGKITSTLVKGLGLMLRNKLSRKIQRGNLERPVSKMDSIMDALGMREYVIDEYCNGR